jgi:hypothetical protein
MASSSRRGLSIMEVIVATGIIALAALTVLSVCSSVLEYRRQSTDALNAARVTDMMVERVVASLTKDTPAGTRDAFWAGSFPYPDTPYREGTHNVAGREFSYAVFAEDIPGIGDASADPPNLLRRVDVYVWWEEERGKKGSKRTVATRLVNSGEEP